MAKASASAIRTVIGCWRLHRLPANFILVSFIDFTVNRREAMRKICSLEYSVKRFSFLSFINRVLAESFLCISIDCIFIEGEILKISFSFSRALFSIKHRNRFRILIPRSLLNFHQFLRISIDFTSKQEILFVFYFKYSDESYALVSLLLLFFVFRSYLRIFVSLSGVEEDFSAFCRDKGKLN